LGENPSEEEIEAKIEELTSDGETGETWSCVLNGIMSNCDSEFIFS
jgi:hypothetical protein